jgi:hypothetical protein
MIPVVVLAVLFLTFSLVGRLGVPFMWGWWTSLRFVLCGMFLLTASAHWGKRRPDLVRMVPSVFPKPALLVTLTGILEILGAVRKICWFYHEAMRVMVLIALSAFGISDDRCSFRTGSATIGGHQETA